MKLFVYKGFPTDFLAALTVLPLVDSEIASKKNVLLFDNKVRRALDRSLLNMEDDEEFWITYEEYALLKDMYPCIREKVNAPTAEQLVYDELKKLPNDYIIFHSVQWVRKNLNRNFTWYENDYLIFHKDYGILLLEVKGGHCYFKDSLMYQQNTVTKKVKILDEGNDPLSQAQRGIQHFRKIIENTALKHEGSICIEPLIWFPSCIFDQSQNLPPNYHDVSFAILDSNAFSSQSGVPLEHCLKAIYDSYGSRRKTMLSEQQVEWIKNLIAPDFDLIPSPSIVKTEIDNAFIRLTSEQAVLLDYIGEQWYAAIQGAAGTGKTMIAQMAAERFGKMGRKVLFLCYNSFLFRYLKSEHQKENVDYYNVDTFVAEFLQMEAGSVENRILAYNSINIDSFPYDDVVIDEAQDLGNDEIVFFKELCELKDGHCFVFYDKNQVVIYDKTDSHTSVKEAEHQILPWIAQSECRLLLSKNCRNTIEIAKTAYSVIDYDVLQKMNDVSGEQPTILFVEKDPKQKLVDIINYYMQQGYKPDEIAVLTMKTEDKSITSGMKKFHNIQFKRDPAENGVLITTARKFKGLENKVIIITDIDEICFSDSAIKKVFYVACSRATHHLSLLIGGGSEKIASIAAAIPGTGFSGKGKIVLKTKTKPLKI